jgi:spore germination protein KA/spore germination protein
MGALILEFILELLREALLRVPKQIGPAIGIVGAIVIGQAAISAGIFSPVLLIIVCISLLASFAIPDYTLVNPFRILKFVLIIFTGALGFYGFTLFITFILIELVSLNSFGVPYLAPWAPFNLYDFYRTIISNSTINPKRPTYLRTKDRTRSK